MIYGMAVLPFDAPGVLQPSVRFSAGTKKIWSIFVPGKDLTGYEVHWVAGIPDNADQLGIINAPFLAPQILVRKSITAGNLSVVVDPTGSTILFVTVRADTVALGPRQYWHQAISYDSDGEPTVIASGPMVLGPSLLPLDLAA